MVSYKLDKYDKYFVAFVLVILTIFNITSCFAVEPESVEVIGLSGLRISPSANYYQSSTNTGIAYFPTERGYIYHITCKPSNYNRPSCYSSAFPEVNVPYTLLYSFSPSGGGPDSFDYYCSQDGYIGINGQEPNIIYVTREKVQNQEGAINDLVANVGPQQLWSVFESGIDFIGVVVLVAFGIFLIVLLIKKLSRGKSDF